MPKIVLKKIISIFYVLIIIIQTVSLLAAGANFLLAEDYTITPGIATPSFNLAANLEGLTSTAGSVINGTKNIKIVSISSDSISILSGLSFHIQRDDTGAYSAYVPNTITMDNKIWTANLDTTKLDNANYNFFAKGWYKKSDGTILYYESNRVNFSVYNGITTSDTSIPTSTPDDSTGNNTISTSISTSNTTTAPAISSGSGITSTAPPTDTTSINAPPPVETLYVKFTDNTFFSVSGDKKVEVLTNIEPEYIAFIISGLKYAEFPAIRIDATNYYFFWRTSEFPDGYYTIKVVARKGTYETFSSRDIKVYNASAANATTGGASAINSYPFIEPPPLPASGPVPAPPSETSPSNSLFPYPSPPPVIYNPPASPIPPPINIPAGTSTNTPTENSGAAGTIPPPTENYLIPQECKEKGFLTPEECEKYFSLPRPCLEQNITDGAKCKDFMYKYAMPQECVDQGIQTQENCVKIIFQKIMPEECLKANISTKEECDKIVNALGQLTPECKSANITETGKCNEYMMKNFLPEECLRANVATKEECDYILRNKYNNLENSVKIDMGTEKFEPQGNFPQECRENKITDPKECKKLMMKKNMPEECRRENADTEDECEKVMFKKYAPKDCVDAQIFESVECEKLIFKKNAPEDCREAGTLTPEACKKHMFEKYSDKNNIPADKLPIECQKAKAKSVEECEKVMKVEYLPGECKDQGLTKAEDCNFYMEQKHMPEECREAGAKSSSECDKVMFKKYAPVECQKAGIESEQECKNFMFNLYAPKAKCEGLDQWQCKNIIGEKHLGNIVATQTKFNEIKNNIAPLAGGESIKIKDIENKVNNAENMIPLGEKNLGIKIIAAEDKLVLNDENNLIQTPSAALMIDSDQDGLPDDMEIRLGTDPNNSDTDNDGYSDGKEIKDGYNPLGIGAFEKKTAPVDEAIMQNKVLGQPKIEGAESENMVIEKISDMEKDRGKENKGYTLSGKAEPNTVLTVYIYSDMPLVVTVQADTYGNWKYELNNSLKDGEHEVYVALNDNTGKIISKSKPLNFFVKEAKAVSTKDFVSSLKETSIPKESEKAISAYLLIAAAIMIGGIAIFAALVLKRRKTAA